MLASLFWIERKRKFRSFIQLNILAYIRLLANILLSSVNIEGEGEGIQMKNNLLLSIGIATGAALYEFINHGLNGMDVYKPIVIFVIALVLTTFVHSSKEKPKPTK